MIGREISGDIKEIWHIRELFGIIWYRLASIGIDWQYLALFGIIWPHLALFGHLWHYIFGIDWHYWHIWETFGEFKRVSDSWEEFQVILRGIFVNYLALLGIDWHYSALFSNFWHYSASIGIFGISDKTDIHETYLRDSLFRALYHILLPASLSSDCVTRRPHEFGYILSTASDIVRPIYSTPARNTQATRRHKNGSTGERIRWMQLKLCQS